MKNSVSRLMKLKSQVSTEKAPCRFSVQLGSHGIRSRNSGNKLNFTGDCSCEIGFGVDDGIEKSFKGLIRCMMTKAMEIIVNDEKLNLASRQNSMSTPEGFCDEESTFSEAVF